MVEVLREQIGGGRFVECASFCGDCRGPRYMIPASLHVFHRRNVGLARSWGGVLSRRYRSRHRFVIRNWIAKLTVVGIALTPAGCVATWGKSYNVALRNERSIVIEYDPALVNLPTVLKVAQDHCGQYGRSAVLDSQTSGNLAIDVNTYRCE